MEAKRRYSTMVFPQGFDGNNLLLNIVLIPRNQNPFVAHSTGLLSHPTATAFAELVPNFEICITNGLDEWPIGNASAAGMTPLKIPIDVIPAANKFQIIQSIATELGAKINMDGSSAAKTDKAPETPLPEKLSVQKYLPESYRNAFNFTNPRHPNAKLDDSYHCALKKDTPKKADWKNSDDLSWGQVFAHILRQPQLARACGMIYSASLSVTNYPGLLTKGGFVYVNITNNDYLQIQSEILEQPDGPFIKRYAARIPVLEAGKARPVFAPMLFPVLHRAADALVDPEPPKAEWDKIFAELNQYNDGFAKIVHAAQQVSNNILSEKQDGPAPQSDSGIRLAWDDEQIMIWYLRQLSANPLEPGKRLDVPLGVNGFRIDVRAADTAGNWASLNLVQSKQQLSIGGAVVDAAQNAIVELPYQVFPSQLDNNINSPYWLPMYFTNWVGKSLVLKDTDAINIHRHAEALTGINNAAVKSVDTASPYNEIPSGIDLRYGNHYEFRVRMMDISGGGPDRQDEFFNHAPSPTSRHHFKRYLAPDLCRIDQPLKLREGLSSYFNKEGMEEDAPSIPHPVIRVKRPLLNYPAVVFTGKYQAAGMDPVALLIASTHVPEPVKVVGIADPDVGAVEIKVEIESLQLDNLLSDSGKENYFTLYTTTREFPKAFDAALDLPVEFHDVPLLLAGNTDDPFGIPALNKVAIDTQKAIPLPTARRIRVTLRAVCKEEDGYYGFSNPTNKDLDTKYGKTSQFWFHQPSATETDLLIPKANVPSLQGIYLQPDPLFLNTGKMASFMLSRDLEGQMPDIVQRFAQKLGLRYNGLTLMGKKGERIVFGCSNRIRHHLAPDHGSITFSSKGDLCNHWLGCTVLKLNRDWTWNGLEEVSFQIKREKKFLRDTDDELEVLEKLGDIEMKHTASLESLQPDTFGEIDRVATTIIFIDAIEPKTAYKKADGSLRFPDELKVRYTITPKNRPLHGAAAAYISEWLALPTTIAPAQVPEIASVGIAFSPYKSNEQYSATEPRQKYLWIELKEPVKDPYDTLFCRVLAYAPDQLISNNANDLISTIPEEPALPIDPEYVRAITPLQTDDMAGLSAMQPMEKASGNDDIHYLLPLPPGLNSESPELFGFFTYEFRIGHGHWSGQQDAKGNLWSTAQGRFGRALRVTGLQHPAPNLLCNVNRDKDRIYLTAPYAKAVWKGSNVTANPPRTQLHGLLYAQVRQADGKAYRNILLDEKLLKLNQPQLQHKVASQLAVEFTSAHLNMVRWTVDHVDIKERANVLVSNLALLDTDSFAQLNLDTATHKNLLDVINSRKAGRAEMLDVKASSKILAAFSKLEQLDKIGTGPIGAHPGVGGVPSAPATAMINAGSKFTTASLVTGAAMAIFKDTPKTATISWNNKEIAALLAQLGLPQDASLSVLAVEVFGNISNIFDQVGYPLDQVELLTRRMPAVLTAMRERAAKQEQALSNELGNYRILRTSPLTEVPFVCCTTCG